MAEKKEKLTRMEKALREKTKKEWRKEKKQEEKRQKSQRGTGDKTPGRPSALRGALIAAGVFVILLLGGFAVLFFDLLSVKATVGNFFGLQAAVTEKKEETLTQYGKELDDRAQAIKVTEQELEQKETSVAARESAAIAVKEQYDQKLLEINGKEAQLEQNITDISNVVKTIEGMDAEAAAGVFAKISDQEYAVTLLKQLKTSTQAAILENMDAQQAAALLQAIKPKTTPSAIP